MSKIREFKLTHQKINLFDINIEDRQIHGLTTLHLQPLTRSARVIYLNYRQNGIGKILANDTFECKFRFASTLYDIFKKTDTIDLTSAQIKSSYDMAFQAVSGENNRGSLAVILPAEMQTTINELQQFTICVEFVIKKPTSGVYFYQHVDDFQEHVFTCHCNGTSTAWFPCFDVYDQTCCWELTFSIPINMVAIAPGVLTNINKDTQHNSKTYYYSVKNACPAINIGFAIGHFEVQVGNNLNDFLFFSLPEGEVLLSDTLMFEHKIVEFYTEFLSSGFPVPSYKQVFVENLPIPFISYSGLTIFGTDLLHTKRHIDQRYITRPIVALALSQQMFGGYVCPRSWNDVWLCKGIAGYMADQVNRTYLGFNSTFYGICKDMEDVCSHEIRCGGIYLDASRVTSGRVQRPVFVNNQHLIPSDYYDMFCKKAKLVVRMIELRLGKSILTGAINKLISQTRSAMNTTFSWDDALISTKMFVDIISDISGKDFSPFMDQWVYTSGCARFVGSFVYNRKRNVLEFELVQEPESDCTLKYAGPITITVQELDGSFQHTFNIEENQTHFDITCHSKSRRNKKKKIPLITREEVDIDLSYMDNDSPVLWVIVDKDHHLLRQVRLEQPEFMWRYMLLYERDVVAQSHAVNILQHVGNEVTRQVLVVIGGDSLVYYRVRIQAYFAYVKLSNKSCDQWNSVLVLIGHFKESFGSSSVPSLVRKNDFENCVSYSVQKEFPIAMGGIRFKGHCPDEILTFLMDLIKLNDNTSNKYDDGEYVAFLIRALSHCITATGDPNSHLRAIPDQIYPRDRMDTITVEILDELIFKINCDAIVPSFRLLVTSECLIGIYTLQKNNRIPMGTGFFHKFMHEDYYFKTRLTASTILADFLGGDTMVATDEFNFLMRHVINDEDPRLRIGILRIITQKLFHESDLASKMSEYVNKSELIENIRMMALREMSICNHLIAIYQYIYDDRFGHIFEAISDCGDKVVKRYVAMDLVNYENNDSLKSYSVSDMRNGRLHKMWTDKLTVKKDEIFDNATEDSVLDLEKALGWTATESSIGSSQRKSYGDEYTSDSSEEESMTMVVEDEEEY